MSPHLLLKLGKPLSKGVKALSKPIRSINDLTDKQRRIYDIVWTYLMPKSIQN